MADDYSGASRLCFNPSALLLGVRAVLRSDNSLEQGVNRQNPLVSELHLETGSGESVSSRAKKFISVHLTASERQPSGAESSCVNSCPAALLLCWGMPVAILLCAMVLGTVPQSCTVLRCRTQAQAPCVGSGCVGRMGVCCWGSAVDFQAGQHLCPYLTLQLVPGKCIPLA